MAAFSKTAPSGTSDLDLLGVDRNNFQVCSDHTKVELSTICPFKCRFRRRAFNLSQRSSRDFRIASVMDSPVSPATCLARRSAVAFLMLSGIREIIAENTFI